MDLIFSLKDPKDDELEDADKDPPEEVEELETRKFIWSFTCFLFCFLAAASLFQRSASALIEMMRLNY